jgi:hypothetical protein
MITEQHVRIAAKSYEIRDALRNLMGKDYQVKVVEWKDFVAALAKAQKCSVVAAAGRLAEIAINPYHQSWIIAASVELCEEIDATGGNGCPSNTN